MADFAAPLPLAQQQQEQPFVPPVVDTTTNTNRVDESPVPSATTQARKFFILWLCVGFLYLFLLLEPTNPFNKDVLDTPPTSVKPTLATTDNHTSTAKKGLSNGASKGFNYESPDINFEDGKCEL